MTVPGQNRAGSKTRQKPVQFGEDALCRNTAHRIPGLESRPGGVGVQAEPQLRRKTDCPQNTQGILVKAGGRVAHTAQKSGLQVPLPAEQVDQTGFGGPGHGVDGEIPPRQVFPQAGDKMYLVGMAAVGVGAVLAEGGDLPAVTFQHHRHRTVLLAFQQQAVPRKQGFHLFGAGTGTDVPVVRCAAQQAVPHAAAHNVGVMPGLLQLVQQQTGRFRRPDTGFFFHARGLLSSG